MHPSLEVSRAPYPLSWRLGWILGGEKDGKNWPDGGLERDS
jgi:hypothetical protein